MNEPARLEPKKIALFLILLALLFAGGGWVFVTFIESEEDKVRLTISEMAWAASDRNPRALTEHMTDEFTVAYRRGGVGKVEVHRVLIRLFLVDYKHGFEVTLTPEHIPVKLAKDGETATAEFRVFAKGKPNAAGGWVALTNREAAGKVRYLASFKKTEEGWRMNSLTFQRGAASSD